METTPFRRARSAEHKARRAQDLVEAARELALEHGVKSVTLTAVAQRAGVHHSAVRRYFDSHRDVLLRLAAQGWDRWADEVVAELHERQVSSAELAGLLTAALARDPLLCDLLANVPLHLEHDVEVARVVEFKHTSGAAIARMRTAIEAAAPGLGEAAALDVITATSALAATLWQATHPGAALATALESDPGLSYLAVGDFEPTLVRLLTATIAGLTR
ncbi:TetR family transcriptional regulator [Amycolatopsis rhabdoformis]|uniref:TetR family transcriptional regulator n=1 Tax=Amycolatopsis rhabdoformis TaxID=1448059 RepID=A0ABZ1HWF7_9PSEU|nr:TetR family transcriptional regulator [Amycolatopsis rhabdoformis]WSE26549.1 TetR family transcriptional regulator [Amycolatopsis rhabdoformis]